MTSAATRPDRPSAGQPSSRPAVQPRAGFTIPELLLAVVAIAIVAGIAIPMHFGRADVTLENACILLAEDLRAAQNTAAYRGQAMSVVFDEDGGGYRVVDEHGSVVQHPRTDLPFIRRYDRDGVFEGVHVRLVDLGDDRTLVYDSRGFALEAGRLSLAFDGALRDVLVARDTGDVDLVGSTSGWSDGGL